MRKYLQQCPPGLAVGAVMAFFTIELDLATLVSFWGDKRFFVIVGALLIAAIWPTRAKWAAGAGAGALAVLWMIVCFTPISRALVKGLDVSVAPEPADAVVVLGSRLQSDGELTATSMSRLIGALELVGEGYTDTLIVTELPFGPRHEDAARALNDALGVGANIEAVGPVDNTYDEGLKTAEHCSGCRILLVTSPTHMRRAAATFEAAGVTVIPVASMETAYDLQRLDRPHERLRGFGSSLHERVGYWWYKRRGRILKT